MFDDLLRRLKDRLLAPLARALGPTPATLVSIVAAAVGLGAAAAAGRRAYGVALLLWLLNRILDGLDGAVARAQHRTTDFGAYVDILLDFVVYAAVPLALAWSAPDARAPWAALLLVAAFYLNAASWMYLSALLERRGAGAGATPRLERPAVTMPAAIVGGTETIVAYALFLALPSHIVPLFGAFTALVLASVVQRVLWAARHLT